MNRLSHADERINELTLSKKKTKEKLREWMENESEELRSSDELKRILEHEMNVRVRVETELQNLQKVSCAALKFSFNRLISWLSAK